MVVRSSAVRILAVPSSMLSILNIEAEMFVGSYVDASISLSAPVGPVGPVGPWTVLSAPVAPVAPRSPESIKIVRLVLSAMIIIL